MTANGDTEQGPLFDEEPSDEIGRAEDTVDIPEDPRFSSGVPSDQKSGELDFIQMTGLTRSQPNEKETPAPELAEGAPDDGEAISFYEKGVADVDASAGPSAIESTDDAEDLVPMDHAQELGGRLESQSAEDLRSLVEDLAREESDLVEPEALELDPEETPEAYPMMEVALPEEREEQESERERRGDAESPEVFSQLTGEGADLLQAEELLNTLEEPPREEIEIPPISEPFRQRSSNGTSARPVVPTGRVPSRPRRAAGDNAETTRRRRSRNRSHRLRRVVRLLVSLSLLAVVGGLAFYAFTTYFMRAISSEEDRWEQAQTLAKEGRFQEASRSFERFANDFSGHPRQAEAQFEAALLLQMVPDSSDPQRHQLLQRSTELFDAFLDTHPNSPKRGRVQCLKGMLQYELGNFSEAVELLRNPALFLDDPDSELPALRALAGAFEGMAEYEAAESTYLQAALLPRNVSAEQDYGALASMYQKMAGNAGVGNERTRYLERATTYLVKASKMPGMSLSARRAIEVRLGRLAADLKVSPTDLLSEFSERQGMEETKAFSPSSAPVPTAQEQSMSEETEVLEPNPLDEGKQLPQDVPEL
jgi:tetratricopeptide (TPR) repeat protein